MIEIDREQAAELAAAILGIDPPEDDVDVDSIKDQFFKKMGLDMDDLAVYAALLLPLCTSSQGPLTGNYYRGFARDYSYIVKIQAKPAS